MADDDVQLTDLALIQRYSLAVRGATASRAELVAALQADLAWLQGGRRSGPAKAAAPAGSSPAKTAPARTPVPAEAAAPAGTAPAKKATAKSTSTKRKA